MRGIPVRRPEEGEPVFVRGRGTYGVYGRVEKVGTKLAHIRTCFGLRKVRIRELTWKPPWSRDDTEHWEETGVLRKPGWMVG